MPTLDPFTALTELQGTATAGGHIPYMVYRHPETGDLWDPRTGDQLLRQSTDARLSRLLRTLRRYLIWIALILLASLPALGGK